MVAAITTENDQCAYWLVSAISKLAHSEPRMSLGCLLNIIKAAMPAAAEGYAEYCGVKISGGAPF